jgi:diacylglycerol kinase (ATP)
MRVFAILNPVAGASSQRQRVRADGVDVELAVTAAAGDGIRLASAAARHADAVVAIGGDGTVGEVVNGLTGTDVPLLIWPTGTENLVAKALGFAPCEEVLAGCLRHGSELTIDVGVANGRSFLVVAGVGFDAEVVHRLARHRSGHITHLSYSGPIWRTFWEHRFPALRVETDDGRRWEGRGLVFVGNIGRYALGLPVVRDAHPGDGALDLLILPCANHLTLIGHSIRTLMRRHIEHPGVIYRRVQRVRIEADNTVPFELDGDATGCCPLEVHILPRAIRALVPPETARKYNRPS